MAMTPPDFDAEARKLLMAMGTFTLEDAKDVLRDAHARGLEAGLSAAIVAVHEAPTGPTTAETYLAYVTALEAIRSLRTPERK